MLVRMQSDAALGVIGVMSRPSSGMACANRSMAPLVLALQTSIHRVNSGVLGHVDAKGALCTGMMGVADASAVQPDRTTAQMRNLAVDNGRCRQNRTICALPPRTASELGIGAVACGLAG
jgi:hypothetical protein